MAQKISKNEGREMVDHRGGDGRKTGKNIINVQRRNSAGDKKRGKKPSRAAVCNAADSYDPQQSLQYNKFYLKHCKQI
jgi:hypothetical protein